VAETGEPAGTIAGMIVVWLILDEAHVASIAVHPDHRRRGIGARLLCTALKEAIQKGSRLATLEVRANNLGAQELYTRFGFKVVGRRTRYYRDNNEDALIMTVEFNRFPEHGESYLSWLEGCQWERGAGKPVR
jgi:ribosomal-protein-alanine N-acetyltransferase